MELLQAELLGWTCCVTDLLILQRDFLAGFMAVVGVGRLWCVQCGFWNGLATSFLWTKVLALSPVGEV